MVKKPDWQIKAEKAGWTPPTKKEEKDKHPPHQYGSGYTIKADGIKELVKVCLYPSCHHEKRERITSF